MKTLSINEKVKVKEHVSLNTETPKDMGSGDSLIAWIDSKNAPTSATDATFTTGGAIVGNWTKTNLTATVGSTWSRLQLPVDASPVTHICGTALTGDTYGRVRITVDGYAGDLPTGATASLFAIYNTSTLSYQVFDLTNGVLGLTVQGTGGISDETITDLGGGIYRCSCIFDNNTASSFIRCYFCKTNILANFQADGVGNIYWANAKVEQLHCSALSTKIRKPVWINPDVRTWVTQSNIGSIIYNDTDGYIIPDLVDATAKLHIVQTQACFYPTAGNKTVTVDVKSGGGNVNYVYMAVGSGATDGYFYTNLSDGTISGAGGAAYISSNSVSLGGGWYRISMIHSSSTSNNYLYPTKTNVSTSYQGDGNGKLQIKNISIVSANPLDISGPQFDFANATDPNQPLLIDQNIGGVLCPYFQPDDSGSTFAKYLFNSTTKATFHMLHDGTPTTVLSAFKYIAGTDGYERWILCTGGTTTGYNLSISATSTNRLTWEIVNNVSKVITSYATIVPGQIYVVSTRFDRNHYSYRVNGIEIDSGATLTSPSFTDSTLNFTLGRNNGSLPSARWAPRDLLIYREYLSDEDNQKMEQFLARRCNIAF